MAKPLTARLTNKNLKYWTDKRQFLLGQNLFLHGKVEILYSDVRTARCKVSDADGDIIVTLESQRWGDGVIVDNTCRHYHFCYHDVAAALAVRHADEGKKAQWEQSLSLLSQVTKSPRRPSSRPFWIFLAFDKYFSPPRLTPYRLWLHELPGDILPEEQSLDMETLAELTAHNHWLWAHIKEARRSLNMDACVNLDEKAAPLLKLVSEVNATSRYSYYGWQPSRNMNIDALLTMVVHYGLPIAIKDGDTLEPLRCVLDVRPGVALEKHRRNITLSVVWEGHTPQGDAVRFSVSRKDNWWWLNEKVPYWGLGGNYLVRFADTIRVDDVDDLRSLMKMPAYKVPLSEVENLTREIMRLVDSGVPVSVPEADEEVVDTDPVPQLYLSEEEGEFRASLRFAYGDYVLPYRDSAPREFTQWDLAAWKFARIIRRTEFEEQAYKRVRSAKGGLKGAGKDFPDDMLLLRAKVDAVDFLLKKAPALLEEGFEIYGEENLKSVRINRHKPSISLNVSSGIDWFDLQAAIKFGETEADWKDVRRALRKKERYIKLADGSIGEIPEDWVKRFRHLFGMSEETEDGLRMSSQQVVLLDQLLEDMDEFRVDEEFQRRRERLRNFSGIKDVPLPAGFRGELRPYQKAGYNWLHFLHEYEFGGCLADDMGLGKTVQVLTFLLSLRESGHAQSPDLIVVPRSLLVNWQREAERFTPSLKVTLHFGQTRTKEQPDFSPYDLVITTYGTMLRDSMMLREQHFHYIVLDESQAIKNPLAKTSRAARRLNSDHRLVMTGTPVENTTFELWSQFAFLNPGLLGSLEYFKSEFGNPIEKEQDEQASRLLRGMVYPFILRRTKEQVAPELPPRTERVIYCDMTPAQQKFYLRTRDFYRAQLLGILDEQGMDKARMKILEGLLRLRQICNHPKLVSEKYRGDSAKMEVLLETLETLHSEGHRALVFSQFVQMLTLLRRELDARGIPYEYLDGSTTNRQKRVDRFQEDESIPFFLISLKAGGVGLNLTGADYVLHVDPWWNPAVEMQATDRTHRIGQEKPVFVYRFITRESVEEKILQLQERKKELVRQLISTEGAFFKNLTAEDVRVLFT